MDWAVVLPEAFLFLAALLLLLFGTLFERQAARWVAALAVLALFVAAFLVLAQGGEARTAFFGHFVVDRFSAFVKVLLFVTAGGTILIATGYLQDLRLERFEWPLLALLATLGMAMMVSANSLLALYMALELQSLPLYVLAASRRDSLRASEAGLKYFVLGALASGLLLYGASLVYGFAGTLSFAGLAEAAQGGLSTGALVGLIFLIAGLAFKLAAVPFHMWTPDVYEGAPTPVTAFLAGAPKLAAMALALRLLFGPFADAAAEWQQVIVLVAVASMLLGAFAAIGQRNIKRLMAYSSIGHVGYALIGVAAADQVGLQAVLVFMAIYVIMTVGCFGCILMMRRGGRYVEQIEDLAGLSRHQPMMALAMAVFMFSMAGIPPLAGFFGKLYVFLAAVEAGLVWLAVVGVLTSVVAAFYYLRIVKVMYFDAPAQPFDPLPRPELHAVTAASAVFVVGFLFLPGPIVDTAQLAAEALLP